MHRRLIIYPNGHDSGRDVDGGKHYLSVDLAIADTAALPANWEVNAVFSICVLDHISGNYRYTLGRTRRFHAMKTQWGYPKFISNEDFKDPSNGYLTDDICVLGADVFIKEKTAITECLSLKDVCTVPYKREFKIENFSTLKQQWVSDVFIVGERKWKVSLYPNGHPIADGRNLSIFLDNADSKTSTPFGRVKPCYSICIKDQSSQHKHHKITNSGKRWFTYAEQALGWHSFIDLASLNDPDRGFIANDCCLLEIELSVQAIAS